MTYETLSAVFETVAAIPNAPHELIAYLADLLISHYPATVEVPHA